jgi:alpha-beta hydrolase superfamily lysophospholipase
MDARTSTGSRDKLKPGWISTPRAEVENDKARGCVVHVPTPLWWQARLRAERDCLYWVVMLTHDEACPL